MTKKNSTMKGKAGVQYCGSTSCIITDNAAMIAEKTISRTENFLIGIFFAMVGIMVDMKGIPNCDIKGYSHAHEGAHQRQDGFGVQPFI